MIIYYSASTGGFYASDINDVMPDDAVEISADQQAALLDAQAAGKIILAGSDGRPTLADHPGPALTDYLPIRRWQAEIGGVRWNGWNLPTDDRSQAKYLAELAAVNEGVRQGGDPWKFDHGFEALTNQQVRDMAVAARNHVLACFAKEAEVAQAIAKGTITTTAQIDAAFEALS